MIRNYCPHYSWPTQHIVAFKFPINILICVSPGKEWKGGKEDKYWVCITILATTSLSSVVVILSSQVQTLGFAIVSTTP